MPKAWIWHPMLRLTLIAGGLAVVLSGCHLHHGYWRGGFGYQGGGYHGGSHYRGQHGYKRHGHHRRGRHHGGRRGRY